jgi:hypothetical protein
MHIEYTESLQSGKWIDRNIDDQYIESETTIPLEEITDGKQRYYRLRVEQ